MLVTYSAEFQNWAPEMKNAVENASAILAAISERVSKSRSQIPVKAEWKLLPGPAGKPVFRLTVSDAIGTASTDLSLEDLRDPPLLQYCLYRVWGDLLQVRGDYYHQQFLNVSSDVAVGSEGS